MRLEHALRLGKTSLTLIAMSFFWEDSCITIVLKCSEAVGAWERSANLIRGLVDRVLFIRAAKVWLAIRNFFAAYPGIIDTFGYISLDLL